MKIEICYSESEQQKMKKIQDFYCHVLVFIIMHFFIVMQIFTLKVIFTIILVSNRHASYRYRASVHYYTIFKT